MPNSPHRSPSRGHSAGFLTFEAVITYPFHPLVGQTVLVVGDHEHDGIHHFLIRQPQGGFFQVPDWMFDWRYAPLRSSRSHDFPSTNLFWCAHWWTDL